jgi:hypothetical protein
MRAAPLYIVAVLAAAAGCAHRSAPAAAPLVLAPDVHAAPSVRVEVDAARREVLIVAGPFHVPAADAGHAHDARTPLISFDWPVDGWIRGFRIAAYDMHGNVLPRDLMHHLLAYNFDRRQLVHAGVERLFGIGRETADIVLRPSVGVPLDAGSRLGFDAVWHNESGHELHGVHIRLALPYTPATPDGIAYEGFPFHVDVNYSISGSNEFDIPPGRSVHAFEFELPIAGSLIGIGGHMHEYGLALRLEDAETGRPLFQLRGRHDREGRLIGVEQKVFRRWFGLRDARLALEAGRRYQLIAEYENPTGRTIEKGAMAHIAGLFAPRDARQWPALDLGDPEIQEDLAVLLGRALDAHSRPHHHP